MPISIRKIYSNQTIDIRHEAIWPDKKREFCILEDDKNGTCLLYTSPSPRDP